METWRVKTGLATWTFGLESPPADVKPWLSALVERLLEACSVTQWVDSVRVWTAAQGKTPWKGTAEALVPRLNSSADVKCISLDLLLMRVDGEGMSVEIPSGADVTLWVEPDEQGVMAAWLTLSLNCDCDAPITLGPHPNNAVAASTNGPKLSRLLRDLEEKLPAEIVDIEGPDYPDMIDEEGFHFPRVFGTEV